MCYTINIKLVTMKKPVLLQNTHWMYHDRLKTYLEKKKIPPAPRTAPPPGKRETNEFFRNRSFWNI